MKAPCPLVLRPVTAENREALLLLLDQPDLRRRRFGSGLHELHPVDWSETRRTFVASVDEKIMGSAELCRDEDEPSAWELTLNLTGTRGLGGRCTAAVLAYAFSQLDAETVWFWIPQDLVAMKRIAARFGFSCSHSVRQPVGPPAKVFEVDRATWQRQRHAAHAHYLTATVTLHGDEQAWQAVGGETFS